MKTLALACLLAFGDAVNAVTLFPSQYQVVAESGTDSSGTEIGSLYTLDLNGGAHQDRRPFDYPETFFQHKFTNFGVDNRISETSAVMAFDLGVNEVGRKGEFGFAYRFRAVGTGPGRFSFVLQSVGIIPADMQYSLRDITEGTTIFAGVSQSFAFLNAAPLPLEDLHEYEIFGQLDVDTSNQSGAVDSQALARFTIETPVPEPASAVLVASGAALVSKSRKARRK